MKCSGSPRFPRAQEVSPVGTKSRLAPVPTEVFTQVSEKYGLVSVGRTPVHKPPPRPSHKRAASEDYPVASDVLFTPTGARTLPQSRSSTLLSTPRSRNELSDAEVIIRQIINEREASFNSMRTLCVIEEPASEEESQSDESPEPVTRLSEIRTSMEALESEQETKERILASKRRDVKLQVLRLLNLPEDGRKRVTEEPFPARKGPVKADYSPLVAAGCCTPSTDSCDTERRGWDPVPKGKQIGKVFRRRPASLNLPKITNQRRIQLAIQGYLEAASNQSAAEALEAMGKADPDLNVVLVFKSTTKNEIEGVYTFSPAVENLHRLHGPNLPEIIWRDLIQFYYHFDEEDQEFVLLTDRRLSANVDAVMLGRRKLV